MDLKLDSRTVIEQHVLGMKLSRDKSFSIPAVVVAFFRHPPMRLCSAASLPSLFLQHAQTELELLPQGGQAGEGADRCAFLFQWGY